jgi:hypothetical protein
MSPDNEPLEPIPIDPPDNTRTGTNAEADLTAGETAPRKIDPPDNT